MNISILEPGNVVLGQPGDILQSGPLGSCLGIVVYCPDLLMGVMAHIMLPDASPLRLTSPHSTDFRYMDDAGDEILRLLGGINLDRIPVLGCAAGAGNVLQNPADQICPGNILSVSRWFERVGIPLLKSDYGGFNRRQLSLDVSRGICSSSVGDEPESLFVNFHKKEPLP